VQENSYLSCHPDVNDPFTWFEVEINFITYIWKINSLSFQTANNFLLLAYIWNMTKNLIAYTMYWYNLTCKKSIRRPNLLYHICYHTYLIQFNLQNWGRTWILSLMCPPVLGSIQRMKNLLITTFGRKWLQGGLTLMS